LGVGGSYFGGWAFLDPLGGLIVSLMLLKVGIQSIKTPLFQLIKLSQSESEQESPK